MMLLAMSLMYNKNMRGARTVPWGTPDLTFTGAEATPSCKTNWVRLVSHPLIRRPNVPPLKDAGEAQCQKLY